MSDSDNPEATILRASVYFEPRDIWIGIYWTTEGEWDRVYGRSWSLLVYICLVPCVPIKLAWRPRWAFEQRTEASKQWSVK